MTRFTTDNSFDELEAALRNGESWGNPYPARPVKPHAPAAGAPAAAHREYADALEQHEIAETQHKIALDVYNTKQSMLFGVWQTKLKNEYAPGYTDELFNKVYSKAYEDGHSSGYGEVRNYFLDLTDFVDDIIRLSVNMPK